ncbi:acetylornithine deacetylase [Oceanibaculum indicum]|uniref:Probable succinyl-diaminopimelate desuccinylase n=1 Tax=Oceanibaculum indicum P24 TaxID=1207063 RepID=K2JFA2_9PROT|nr:acetylornithine deacetylase [Oceanibaculum indicum]EKE73793.1 acetylornithine deacetylase ArgE [Oceanibaculum indicum P24]
MTDTARAIAMIRRLVAFDTTSALSNLALIEDVKAYLAEYGIDSRLTFDEAHGKANLYATIGPKDKGGVVLSGHTDVVPVEGQIWATDPFEVVQKDGLLYGRGTSDMKSFIAIALALVPELVKMELKTPIHFAFSFDEEVGCFGVKHLIRDIVENFPLPRAVIIGEPTEMKLVTAHKGVQAYRVEVTGVAGHSSLPQNGVNAVFAATDLIQSVKAMQEAAKQRPSAEAFEPPYSSFNIGRIEGGTAGNIIPQNCNFSVEMRIVPEDDGAAMEAELRAAVEALDAELKAQSPKAGATMRLFAAVPPLKPESDGVAEALVRHLTGVNQTGVVAFATEGGLFQEAGISTVMCGPGSIVQAHQPDEFIAISQVEEGIAFMRKLFAWAEKTA